MSRLLFFLPECTMLNAVRQVSRALCRELGTPKRFSLESIVFAVEAYSPVDEVIFVGYDVPKTNPIWGQFRKYAVLPGRYNAGKTVAEVYYASHLDEEWKRFVVCKELCHSLDADEGSYSVTDKSISRLMVEFSLLSNKRPNGSSFQALDAEWLAEVGALELLCPLNVRRELDLSNNSVDDLCSQFGIPLEMGRYAFSREWIEILEPVYCDR